MKKKILFVPYTISNGGGSERIQRLLINRLDKDKYDIYIQEYLNFNKFKEPFDSNVHILKPILDTNKDSKRKINICNKLVLVFPFLFRRKKEKYDVEISFNYQVPTRLLDYSTKTICWNHGTISNLKNSKIRYNVQMKAFKKCSKIVAIAETTKESIVDLYPEYADKVQIIYNGFDEHEIRNKSNESTNKIEPNSILFCGRFDENKNPLRLIKVFKDVIERRKTIHLYFVGQGEQEKDMHSLISKLNIQENVHILGYQSNPYSIMKQVKAICVCSHSEGFPTVICEGMVLGKPFISTRIGGAEELSNHGKTGYVVDTDKELEDSILNIIEDKEMYEKMCCEALKHIKQFTLDAQVEKTEKLIDELLED